jgi:hypothetical protein
LNGIAKFCFGWGVATCPAKSYYTCPIHDSGFSSFVLNAAWTFGLSKAEASEGLRPTEEGSPPTPQLRIRRPHFPHRHPHLGAVECSPERKTARAWDSLDSIGYSQCTFHRALANDSEDRYPKS